MLAHENRTPHVTLQKGKDRELKGCELEGRQKKSTVLG